MRIDKFLKNARIIKRRTVAAEACDGGRVTINDTKAKPGATVKVGDIITVQFGQSQMKVIIERLIDNPKKEEASMMYSDCTTETETPTV